ncbi:hypothetical protein GDO86_017676 [Hymenochirus boettgeri]|uniref:BICD family-like cargo adapter 2 n=1 Tax=Hymenochirus boettgeri TaxID=247094 RepID=A0A8T2IKV4_9PIPI|nr:hypothetical protein GDO86_017676 [Hymenochirus boettgeri]
MQYIELIALREEVKKLREITQQNNSDAHVKQAVIDRDEAIIKKGELELELAKCQMEKENMNLELLGAIRQKVMLRQELEAWQDDMQIVINQQLKAQRQEQAGRGPGAPSNSVQRQNSSRRQKDGGSIFSFFKNI